MTTHTEKLIQDGLWRDISEAPRDGTVYLGVIIQPDGSFGQPFEAVFDDDLQRHVCVFQTELMLHEPTHFRPLPDDRLANALKVAWDFINAVAFDDYKMQNHMEREDMVNLARQKREEIERIAKGRVR